jgi:hypothetical protein
MPPSVSALSLKMVEAIRLTEGEAPGARYPVWVDTRFVQGYFPAERLKELLSQREDLSYLTKTVRNADRNGIPGFTFVREGEMTLNDYFKQLAAQAAAGTGASP